MEIVEVVLEGAIAIAGVTLLGLTLGVLFPYCRGETDKGIKKTDKIILATVKNLTSHSSKPKFNDQTLESICRLRRRKAHLQKDNQNYFFLFLFTSVSFILIGILPLLGFQNSFLTILKPFLAWLAIICLTIGAYFIWRLFKELRAIDREGHN